jgi:hypothetical protein
MDTPSALAWLARPDLQLLPEKYLGSMPLVETLS